MRPAFVVIVLATAPGCGARSGLLVVGDSAGVGVDASVDALVDPEDAHVDRPEDVASDERGVADGDVEADDVVDAPQDEPIPCLGEQAPCLIHDDCCSGLCLAQVCTTDSDPACHPGDGKTTVSQAHTQGDIAVDATHLYWTSVYGGVYRTPKKGGPIETVGQLALGFADVSLDATQVYAAGYDGVQFAPKEGPTPGDPTVSVMTSYAVAADLTNVFYAEFDTGRLVRVGKDKASAQTLSTGLVAPHVMAVDADFVYSGQMGQEPSILRIDKLTGATEVLAAANPAVEGIAVDGGWVYWADGLSISRVRKTDKHVEVLVPSTDGSQGLAVDRTHLYYTEVGGDPLKGIHKVPKEGGSTTVVASGIIIPMNVVVDESCVYWIGTLEVGRAPKD